jgi:hypothetical protein
VEFTKIHAARVNLAGLVTDLAQVMNSHRSYAGLSTNGILMVAKMAAKLRAVLIKQATSNT